MIAFHTERIERTVNRVRAIDLTLRLHTDSLLRVAKDVREIHRAVHGHIRDAEAESRQGLNIHSMGLELDPYIGRRLPFNSRGQVLDFFQDKVRLTRLEQFIMEQVGWEPRTFAKNVLKILLTKDYRRRAFFPSSSRR